MTRTSRNFLTGVSALAACVGATAIQTVQAQVQTLPDLHVTASRLGAGITGASTTVITAEDIERSPGTTLQDVLSREPGIQVQNLFGGVNGAQSVVDMRGFGAAAVSNTLVLINGRRLNDIDVAGVDFSAIPRNSIERIEITRGNSGAVLYGDNAVGGVINIITKTGVGLPPSARVEGAFGSFRQREISPSANGSSGQFAASINGNAINSDGYRVNNDLRQRNGVGDLRYTYDQGSAYLNISGDDQHLGLPGGRRVTATSSELVTDRRGTSTPFDYADKQGKNATAGITRMLAPGAELIVDGGVRRKEQQAGFFVVTFPLADRYVDTTLTTYSFTPRVIIDQPLLGLPSKTIAGLDVYKAIYDSKRSMHQGDAPSHRYELDQRTLAGYVQSTVTVHPGTDVAGGLRLQRTALSARDHFDPTAPAFFPDPQGFPLDTSETEHAYHLGLEHRFNESFAVFGRLARSFRVPNVDERVGMAPSGFGIPTIFDLKTQVSHDREAGVRLRFGGFNLQSSIYDMNLVNEIHFSPATFTNSNLDPTRRYGVETIASHQLTDSVQIKGGLAYTRAVFREGIFAGNDVPLVSRWTGSVGISWNIWQKLLVFDGIVRHVGKRRMDNDQVNLQPLISAHTIVDVRLGGQIDKFFWSASVQNLFDVDYFDYAIASPFPFFGTLGTYNAYPQPGRTYMLRAGMTW
jgi:iron complex outermembrane recepter protein